MTKPLRILLSNDDGYAAQGIKRLYDALIVRHDVTVASPQSEQSGIGHAFTFNKPIRYAALPETINMHGFMVAGTPSDCVKFAISHLLKEKPDIVISGVNSGENSGISGFYSGTVAAAREGAFWRIPSFAFSLCAGGEAFLDEYCRAALDIVEKILATLVPTHGPNQIYYNVNFPSCSLANSKGLKITQQSMAFFDDRYKPAFENNNNAEYIVYGEKKDIENSNDFDSRALLNHYTTITPLHFDATAHWHLQQLSCLEQK